jgi:hypothetical protein
MSGDKLSIVLSLFGFAFGAMTAALTAPKGGRALFLWTLAVLFTAAGVLAVWPPKWLQVDLAWRIVQAAFMPVTVLVVAAMRRGPGAPDRVVKIERQPRPEDAARAPNPSLWEPDMTMQELAQYLKTRSPYAPRYGYDDAAIADEIHTALYQGQITAWARLHPASEEFQIDPLEWSQADLDRIDGHALLKRIRMPVRDLRFARGEVEAAWPPER